jgi:RNA polymerase sigma-70 factor, ECF subfamily
MQGHMPTDEELALDILRGHAESLRCLVERHHGPLFGFLFRMTGGDWILAQDLAQDVFMRMLGAIGQYQHPRPFKPWLYAIAMNLARDHYKRAETRYTLSGYEGDEAGGAGAVDATWESVVENDEARQVAQALAALPEHQREAVVLRYYQDLPLAEIAAVLDIPVGTVKSRLSLGLRRLREILEREQV